jgi:predicted N-acetyltransferase YhbS
LRVAQPVTEVYYLHDMAVDPAARRLGIAPRLLRHAVVHARAAGHHSLALTAVQGAAAYWRRFGFVGVPEEELDAAARARLSSYSVVPPPCLMRADLVVVEMTLQAKL